MLQPADVLLLDEPTNDLDIPTLEILEESLLEYPGALVLVTHDRYMLDRVSTVVLGLDGRGGAERFADYSQWEDWQRPAKSKPLPTPRAGNIQASAAAEPAKSSSNKKKLSYTETRELSSMEESIAAAEEELERQRLAMEEPSIISDGARLHTAALALEQAQREVERLYTRWAELEQKQGVTSESLG